MKFDVIVIAGGFGGLAARALGKAFGREEGEAVALIARRSIIVFPAHAGRGRRVLAGPGGLVNPPGGRGVNVLKSTIEIDWAAKTLILDGGRYTRDHEVGFNHLVVALGSVTDMRAVPGMPEYGWPMKNVSDALRLRAALINRMEEANLVEDGETRTRLLTFVVVGGGYTGVETAGQMLDFIKQAHRFYANLRDSTPRVVLVHAGDELLAEIGPKLGAYARGVLVKRGVEVRLNMRVSEVTARRIILADGSFIEANTVVTTIGNAPNPVVMDLACKQRSGSRARRPLRRSPPCRDHCRISTLWSTG